ncbi:MAG: DUF1311 domain-containing protein [Gammaproteobacteria bacterium]
MKYLIALSVMALFGCVNFSNASCENSETTESMRECYSLHLEKSENQMNSMLLLISSQMKDYVGGEASEEFVSAHNEWSVSVDKLCSNQRKLFGRGSLSGINFITCKNKFIESQIALYQSIYLDSLNP